MRKLRLDFEELAVESFETVAESSEKGTVLARSDWSESTCLERICTCEEETYKVTYCGTCHEWETCGTDEPTYLNCPTARPYPGC